MKYVVNTIWNHPNDINWNQMKKYLIFLLIFTMCASPETKPVQQSSAEVNEQAPQTTFENVETTTTTTTLQQINDDYEQDGSILLNWMSQLPNNTLLSDISIPGTHDSGSTLDAKVGGLTITDTAKTQDLTISEQLSIGVRFFDIRLILENNELEVYHSTVKQNLSFREVLNDVYRFLDQHPSEALIMSIRKEGDDIGDNTVLFEEKVNNLIQSGKKYWLLDEKIATLEDARSKITLLRRYPTESNYSIGINASQNWKDKATFTIQLDNMSLSVQDEYFVEDNNEKWSSILNQFEASDNENTLSLNFTSGYQIRTILGQEAPSILNVSNEINTLLIKHLQDNPKKDYGILIVDYISTELAKLIIDSNF